MAKTVKASTSLETTGSPRSVANNTKFAKRERQDEGKKKTAWDNVKNGEKTAFTDSLGKGDRKKILLRSCQIREISEIFKDDLQKSCGTEMMKLQSPHKSPFPIILSCALDSVFKTFYLIHYVCVCACIYMCPEEELGPSDSHCLRLNPFVEHF